MKIKIFGPISGADDLEKIIQSWLDKNPNIIIHHYGQSQSEDGWLTSTIFYTIKE